MTHRLLQQRTYFHGNNVDLDEQKWAPKCTSVYRQVVLDKIVELEQTYTDVKFKFSDTSRWKITISVGNHVKDWYGVEGVVHEWALRSAYRTISDVGFDWDAVEVVAKRVQKAVDEKAEKIRERRRNQEAIRERRRLENEECERIYRHVRSAVQNAFSQDVFNEYFDTRLNNRGVRQLCIKLPVMNDMQAMFLVNLLREHNIIPKDEDGSGDNGAS